jgi:hypothetical protein
MARQADACWRCGTQWASEAGPRTTLQVLAGGAPVEDSSDPAITIAERAAPDAHMDADRWASDGGSFVSEAAARAR